MKRELSVSILGRDSILIEEEVDKVITRLTLNKNQLRHLLHSFGSGNDLTALYAEKERNRSRWK